MRQESVVVCAWLRLPSSPVCAVRDVSAGEAPRRLAFCITPPFTKSLHGTPQRSDSPSRQHLAVRPRLACSSTRDYCASPVSFSLDRPLLPMADRDDVLQNTLPAVEQALGYRFRDRGLLLTALTHRSFCNEADTSSGHFDELEWLGDSVLQLAISSWLFRSAKGSRRSSGQLSITRQRFVDAGACEAFAVKLNLVRGSTASAPHIIEMARDGRQRTRSAIVFFKLRVGHSQSQCSLD